MIKDFTGGLKLAKDENHRFANEIPKWNKIDIHSLSQALTQLRREKKKMSCELQREPFAAKAPVTLILIVIDHFTKTHVMQALEKSMTSSSNFRNTMT